MHERIHLTALILGHGQHGKDTVAEMFQVLFGSHYISSSLAALDAAVWPALMAAGLSYPSKQAAYQDRMHHRALWKKAISDFNTPDKSSLAKLILETNDLYVGMRCDIEFAASKHLFNKIFWVERPGKPQEPEMTIKFDPEIMIPLINVSDAKPENLRDQILKAVYQ